MCVFSQHFIHSHSTNCLLDTGNSKWRKATVAAATAAGNDNNTIPVARWTFCQMQSYDRGKAIFSVFDWNVSLTAFEKSNNDYSKRIQSEWIAIFVWTFRNKNEEVFFFMDNSKVQVGFILSNWMLNWKTHQCFLAFWSLKLLISNLISTSIWIDTEIWLKNANLFVLNASYILYTILEFPVGVRESGMDGWMDILIWKVHGKKLPRIRS